MTDFIYTLLSAALINNFVLQQPLGADPLIQASPLSRHRLHALGIATCWLILASGIVSYLLLQFLLSPLDLLGLRLFVVVPVIVLLITPSLKALQTLFPQLDFDGLWLLLLGNAGVAGVLLLNIASGKGPGQLIALSLGTGLGFWMVLSLLDDLQQRVRSEDIPQAFRGVPIQLMGIGLMGLAFLGFNGLVNA